MLEFEVGFNLALDHVHVQFITLSVCAFDAVPLFSADATRGHEFEAVQRP